MPNKMIMGNEAIALGALASGVNLASGYPGTPSSEIIEFIAKYNRQGEGRDVPEASTYVEWSVNEKAAVEVAFGASIAGSRSIVTMKQVGLNVASDPVMCISYVGVKGGLVIVSADDPGPISSQTEQDTRLFGLFSKIPVFDPSSPREAFEMTCAAFELSEKYQTPVIVRPTTRVCHAYQAFEMPLIPPARKRGVFEKDSKRWVIFPRASYLNHKRIFERNERELPDVFSKSSFNSIQTAMEDGVEEASLCASRNSVVSATQGRANVGICASGISYAYAREAIEDLCAMFPECDALKEIKILKIGTPYPFPAPLAETFLNGVEKVICFEELEPVLERELIYTCGRAGIKTKILGKLSGDAIEAGENSVQIIKEEIAKILDLSTSLEMTKTTAEMIKAVVIPSEVEESLPELPVRPPVLCAGCPHRASFYAVKVAMKNKKTAYCGDIGCYTLGNAAPLDMCDSCLCMGADITMAQGLYHNEADRYCFSFIGDSTFFASGIPGVVNAVYNQARQVICVLDNSTTAMTGHQVHPGTGRTMMGDVVEKVSIEKILKAVGVEPVITVDPLDLEKAVKAVQECTESNGVSAIIFKSPCVAIASKLGYKFPGPNAVDSSKCIGCKKCISSLGCPAISIDADSKKPVIDPSTCTGCGLCQKVCPASAILPLGERGNA